MYFDPKVWGPHYWFFLHTIAESYPQHPNDVIKKKYYDFIQNLPVFIPVGEMGNYFSELLDKHPVSPYLDNRDSFVKWMHFMHNKVNAHLGYKEISLPKALESYRDEYKSIVVSIAEDIAEGIAEKVSWRKHYLHIFCILVLLVLIFIWYE